METRSCNTFESYNKIFVCVSVMFMIASNTSCGNAPMSEEAKTIYYIYIYTREKGLCIPVGRIQRIQFPFFFMTLSFNIRSCADTFYSCINER